MLKNKTEQKHFTFVALRGEADGRIIGSLKEHYFERICSKQKVKTKKEIKYLNKIERTSVLDEFVYIFYITRSIRYGER